MPNYQTPGVYVEEVSTGPRPIEAVGSSCAAFLGYAPDLSAHVHDPTAINNWTQFVKEFADVPDAKSTHLSRAVYAFFDNGGSRCFVVNLGKDGVLAGKTVGTQRQGVAALEEVDEVAIVAAPGFTDPGSYDAVLSHCEKMKDRVAILDSPEEIPKLELLANVATEEVKPPSATGTRARGAAAAAAAADAGADGTRPKPAGLKPRSSPGGYGAVYAPWITVRDPFDSSLLNVPPSGAVAGIYARTDGTRGVHKAPANEIVRGALNVAYRITKEDQGNLNQAGVNCIRFFPTDGIRIWGARTLADDPQWRYINVRRLFNMVEESIARSTRWVVFEPNDQTLWKSIKRDVGAFLTRLWRDGALMGATPDQAFFVKCDEETNPPDVIDSGTVVTLIGIAPVKPAEFIVFRIGQHTGGTDVKTEEKKEKPDA